MAAAADGLMGEQGADLVGRRSPTAAAFHGSCCICCIIFALKRGDYREQQSNREMTGKRSGGSTLVAGGIGFCRRYMNLLGVVRPLES